MSTAADNTNNPDGTVTLDNCAREPIHIPGSIQPHGALLAFDRLGRLAYLSTNARELLGLNLQLGRAPRLAELAGDEQVYRVVQQAVADIGAGEAVADSHEVRLNGRTFDLVAHAHAGYGICEFELRDMDADSLASFSQKAYRSIDRLKRQRSIDKLLEMAVVELRAMTGFDRVMAYRFRHDDSGDIVAEARRDDLEPYFGRRYPASDIPAQARRLYVLNTLRLIADVAYKPLPIQAEDTQTQPLDLSHSVLRSVSPIHVEYLSNMGVSASMSVSIVVGGRLWGMIACHHMAPLQVPYSIRMAADVTAQIIASSVQTLSALEREAEMARAALLRTDIAAQIAQGHDAVDVLALEAAAVRESLNCDAVLISHNGRLRCHGPIDETWAAALIDWLESQQKSMLHVDRGADLPIQAGSDQFCGVLALRYDAPRRGWLVALRREQIETIRWGGKPEKNMTHGPLGPRLTPRGSFAEWRETVRGTAVPWSETGLEIATLLLDSVSRAHADRVIELDRLRSQFWAVLGHDLRDPLHTLSMASVALDRQRSTDRMASVIRNSTNRMQRLLRDLQDITRLQNGLGLAMTPETIDLAKLMAELLEEQRAAYPDMALEAQLPPAMQAHIDPMRYLQMAANLLSNARHHGKGLIHLVLSTDSGQARLNIRNPSAPIAPELVAGLFDPFKRSSLGNTRNPGSMGLGLYIVDQVARAQGGSVQYEPGDGEVGFTLLVPLAGPDSA